MTATTTPATTTADGAPRMARRAGLVLTALVSAFLLLDLVLHLLGLPVVREATIRLGFAPGLAPVMGVLELVFLGLHLYRRTSVLGALLLTAYLGGACAAQVRIDAPLSTLLFPVYVAVALWAGLWLREPAVRALLPLRRGRA